MEWKKKFKGTERGGAWIYTHPNTLEGRAIVENHNGVFFNGKEYGTVAEAKRAALAPFTLNRPTAAPAQ